MAVVVQASGHQRTHHRPGCKSAICDHRVDVIWGRRHPPPFRFNQFELCVANRESGDGQATLSSARFVTIRWDYVGEGYEGAFNWVNSTWLAMGGGRYAQHANEASPKEQTLIFRAHANSQDWPLTVPACGG